MTRLTLAVVIVFIAALRGAPGPAVRVTGATASGSVHAPTIVGAEACANGARIPCTASAPTSSWHTERRISFYGPGGFYGRRTACGQVLTTRLVGVASRTLPCGTKVRFRYRNPYDGKTREIVAPVVDWGPARWTGNNFDLTGYACVRLVGSRGKCWTLRNVQWRLER
jgi:hypothetical protein